MRNFQFLCGQLFFFLSFLAWAARSVASYLAAVGEYLVEKYLVTQLSHTHALALLGQHKHTRTLSVVACLWLCGFFLVGDFFVLFSKINCQFLEALDALCASLFVFVFGLAEC